MIKYTKEEAKHIWVTSDTHFNHANIIKYLGITLFPQAGVALGMAIKAKTLDPKVGSLIASITLFAVLIYELVGPILTKMSLLKAGEIKPEGKVSARKKEV